MRHHGGNAENLGAMAGTMKHVGDFTGARVPPHVLVGKGFCWRCKGTHLEEASRKTEIKEGRKTERKQARWEEKKK